MRFQTPRRVAWYGSRLYLFLRGCFGRFTFGLTFKRECCERMEKDLRLNRCREVAAVIDSIP